MQPSPFPGQSFSKTRPASCCRSSHHSLRSFLVHVNATTLVVRQYRQMHARFHVMRELGNGQKSMCSGSFGGNFWGNCHLMQLERCPSVDTLSKLSTQGRWLDTWLASGRSSE